MRDYDRITERVLERRDEYNEHRKNSRKSAVTAVIVISIIIAVLAAALPVGAVVATAIRNNGTDKTVDKDAEESVITDDRKNHPNVSLSETLISDEEAKYGTKGNKNDEDIKINLYYTYSDIGTPVIACKEIKGSAAREIANALSDYRLTGGKTEALSDKTYAELDEELARIPETIWDYMWVETGTRLFRAGRNGQISIVEEYLSEGQEITIDNDDIFGLLSATYWYWPSDYWSGTYKDGKLTVSHTYNADTTIGMKVTGMYIETSAYEENKNTATLEITSTKDQSVYVYAYPETGGCEVFRGSRECLDLKAGEPREVTLDFGGNNYIYYLKLSCDNTVLYIRIDLT